MGESVKRETDAAASVRSAVDANPCWKFGAGMLSYRGLICEPCRVAEDEARRRSHLSKAERAYEDEFGLEVAERQRELAKQLWPCCGEHREGSHHEACGKYVAPEQTVHANQGALL